MPRKLVSMSMLTIITTIFAVLAAAWPMLATAQAYPAKPIKLLIGFPGGSNIDILARPVAQRMAEMLGQPVVIDNQPGAGGIVANDKVAKAPPDGYTLLALPGTALTSTPHMHAKMPYDSLGDFTPVAPFATFSSVLIVNPHVPANTAKDLIVIARAKPGVLTFASAGVGSGPHLNAELFMYMAHIRLTHVPYKGSLQAFTDLIGGRIDLMFSTPAPSMPHVKAGKLRAIGVTGLKRNPMFPGVPTITESGLPGYDTTGWHGILAPARLPKNIIDQLNAAICKIVTTPAIVELYANQGVEVATSTPENFAAMIRDEYAKYGKLIRAAGITPE